MSTLLHERLDVSQVLLQRLWVVLEVAGRFCEHACVFHAELVKEFGQDDATHGIHGIKGHLELAGLDSLHIHQVKPQHHVDVLLVVGIVLDVLAQMVHISILEILSLSDAEHLFSLCLVEELALLVKELQGIPHTGIVAGSEDDTTASLLHGHGNLSGRSGSQSDVDHIESHAHECSTHDVLYHLTGDTCITSHHNLVGLDGSGLTNQRSVCAGELHDVEGIERITSLTADGAADT